MAEWLPKPSLFCKLLLLFLRFKTFSGFKVMVLSLPLPPISEPSPSPASVPGGDPVYFVDPRFITEIAER